MRKIILILAFAACLAAAAALESKRDTNFDSWHAYCDTYGTDMTQRTRTQ